MCSKFLFCYSCFIHTCAVREQKIICLLTIVFRFEVVLLMIRFKCSQFKFTINFSLRFRNANEYAKLPFFHGGQIIWLDVKIYPSVHWLFVLNVAYTSVFHIYSTLPPRITCYDDPLASKIGCPKR